MLLPAFESEILSQGKYRKVVGIDEVGRGCWAGPVSVGAYVFTSTLPVLEGIMDSKAVKPETREALHAQMQGHPYVVRHAAPNTIDSLGIVGAISQLIQNIVYELSDAQTLFIIDGQFTQDFGMHTTKIIKADSLYYCVAAASILAKVERDALMSDLEKAYPEYGFATHKGYGTRKHAEILKNLGPTAVHRKSFKPVAHEGLNI